MLSVLFADSSASDYHYERYVVPLTFLLYLLACECALLLLWGLARRLFPARPGTERAPMSFTLLLLAGQPLIPVSWSILRTTWEGLDPIGRADAVVTVHFAFMLTVIFVLVLVCVGGARGWRWVRNFWLRLTHLIAITLVAGQAYLGFVCPLTSWEATLRDDSYRSLEGASFLGVVSHQGLFLLQEGPDSATPYLVAYLVFALLVICSWVWVRPDWPVTAPPLTPQPPLPQGERGSQSSIASGERAPW